MRLLQLCSSNLPVGGYSFSLGLEYAVEAGWVTDLKSTEDWLQLQLFESIARVDLPLLLRLHKAISEADTEGFHYWNQTGLACRETKELLLTETAMGSALLRLLKQLDIPLPACAEAMSPSFIGYFVIAANHWNINSDMALVGLFWCWLEAQVAAAIKLVPLGQTDAQRLLGRLQEASTDAFKRAEALGDDEVGGSLPRLALASARHELQYCRLFRS